MEHSFQLSNPTSGPKSVHGPLSLWEGRASLLLSSLPCPHLLSKTYKRERNANLGGGTLEFYTPNPIWKCPYGQTTKKEILKLWAGNKLLHLLSTWENLSPSVCITLPLFESLLGWKSRLEVASPCPPRSLPWATILLSLDFGKFSIPRPP